MPTIVPFIAFCAQFWDSIEVLTGCVFVSTAALAAHPPETQPRALDTHSRVPYNSLVDSKIGPFFDGRLYI